MKSFNVLIAIFIIFSVYFIGKQNTEHFSEETQELEKVLVSNIHETIKYRKLPRNMNYYNYRNLVNSNIRNIENRNKKKNNFILTDFIRADKVKVKSNNPKEEPYSLFINGPLSVKAKNLYLKKLCIGDTCYSVNDFRNLFNKTSFPFRVSNKALCFEEFYCNGDNLSYMFEKGKLNKNVYKKDIPPLEVLIECAKILEGYKFYLGNIKIPMELIYCRIYEIDYNLFKFFEEYKNQEEYSFLNNILSHCKKYISYMRQNSLTQLMTTAERNYENYRRRYNNKYMNIIKKNCLVKDDLNTLLGKNTVILQDKYGKVLSSQNFAIHGNHDDYSDGSRCRGGHDDDTDTWEQINTNTAGMRYIGSSGLKRNNATFRINKGSLNPNGSFCAAL